MEQPFHQMLQCLDIYIHPDMGYSRPNRRHMVLGYMCPADIHFSDRLDNNDQADTDIYHYQDYQDLQSVVKYILESKKRNLIFNGPLQCFFILTILVTFQ